VWGIGRKSAEKLKSKAIGTALRLKDSKDDVIRKLLGICAVRTAWELRGTACVEIRSEEDMPKSIRHSRSFGRPVVEAAELREAVSVFAAAASERMREQGLTAGSVSVFVGTGAFSEGPRHFEQGAGKLPVRTLHAGEIIEFACGILDGIRIEGMPYRKAGVILSDISGAGSVQPDLFARPPKPEAEALYRTVDEINRRFGTGTLRHASEMGTGKWKAKSEFCSDSGSDPAPKKHRKRCFVD
jgi:DNA polymerase V